ncbi:MAG: 50S ribosomal protein L23 [Candidatus Niyogibacteria bacterium]|nr:50S ribosomal protein L23 [Candidatus Niyogibacteria bacterium]
MFKLNPFKKEKKPAFAKASADKPAEKSKTQPIASAKTEKKEPSLKASAHAPSGKYPLGVLILPRVTEKATRLIEGANQYTFEVSDKANADFIRRAVEGKYGVRVRKVNVLNQYGKKVRLGRQEGWRKGFKKAMVTLEKGQSIEFT